MFLALLPFLGWQLYKKLTLKRASPAWMERTRKAEPFVRPCVHRLPDLSLNASLGNPFQ